VFSQRDSGIKAFGFWKAVVTHKVDAVFCLDDDCFPTTAGPVYNNPHERFVNQHLAALAGGAKWAPSVGEPTRGLPYYNPGLAGSTMLHMGTWLRDADYDAVQELAHHRAGVETGRFKSPPGVRLLHPDNYVPMCAMNISFRSELLPLMYFPKMGVGVPYRRFDDIWCGVILQRCARHLRLRLSVGDPAIDHRRASRPLVNLEKEAPGIAANEQFWQLVDNIVLIDAVTPLECMQRIGAGLRLRVDEASCTVLQGYLHVLGGCIADWCDMLSRAGWR
jgi:hypothetical protein